MKDLNPIGVVLAVAVVGMLAIVGITAGCDTSKEIPAITHGPPIAPENEVHRFNSRSVYTIVEVIHLNDGTRCAVYHRERGGGITCDWNRNDWSTEDPAEPVEESEASYEKRPL